MGGFGSGGGRARFGHDGAVGTGDGVSALYGVGDGFARGEGAGGGGHDGGGDGGAALAVAANDLLHGAGNLVAIGAGEALYVLLLGLLLVLRICGWGVAGEGFEVVVPGEVGGVEDIEACIAAELFGVVGVVAADDDDLAVVKVTCVPHAGRGDRLMGGVNLDPGEGWDGQDPHVGILRLVQVGN